MCFWSLLWSWQKDANWRLRICFVSRSDTPTRTIATWADTLFSLVCCGKSGWALGSVDLVAWTVFWFVKDDVLDADPSRSRGFEGVVTFRKKLHLCPSKFGNIQGKCFHIYWSFCHFRSSTSPCPEGSCSAPEISRLFGDGGSLPCSRPWLPTRSCYDVWRWCLWPDSNNAPQESIWMGRQTSPQGGTRFRMLRAQFWTLAQSK